MIKSDLKRRVLEVERKVQPTTEGLFKRKLERFLDRYGVFSVDDLIVAIENRNRLEAVNSDWIKSLIEKGGIGDLLEILQIMDELNEKHSQLSS